MSSHGHQIATTDEEEQLAMELAIAASLHEAAGSAEGTHWPLTRTPASSAYPPVRPTEPQMPSVSRTDGGSQGPMYPVVPGGHRQPRWPDQEQQQQQPAYPPPKIIDMALPNGGGFHRAPHPAAVGYGSSGGNNRYVPLPVPVRPPPRPQQQQHQQQEASQPRGQQEPERQVREDQPAPKPSNRPPGASGGGFLKGLSAAGAAAASAARSGLAEVLPGGCAGCGGLLGLGPYMEAAGRRWHHGCFRCGGCHQPIGSNGNAASFVQGEDGQPYHAQCYRELHNPRCYVCQQLMSEWQESSFWRLPYCPAHIRDGTLQCCSCNKLQKHQDEWVQLQDGRPLCLECLDTIVVDTKDCQPLYVEVMDFYRAMGMPLPYKAPLILVEGQVLNDFSEREGGRATGPVFHVRGLCLAEVYRTIPMVVQMGSSPLGPGGSRGGGLLSPVSSISTPLGQAINSNTGRTAPTGVREHCSVTCILVLYGLPRLLMGSIIAHELLHAYLRMRHVTGLPPQVEEGLGQLMALLWLDSQGEEEQGVASKHNERLSSYLGYQIRTDSSNTYGEGFRIAMDKFQQRGLRALVEHVIQHHAWPDWEA